MLFDGEINGQPRKLVAQAARNGYFFVLDRTNGKAIVSSEYVEDQLGEGLRREGTADSEPGEAAADRRRARDARIRAAPPTGRRRASARRPACSTSTRRARSASIYIYDPGDNPQGWGGTDRGGWAESMLQAIDYKTGKVKWSHKWEAAARSGLLSTAGNLLFAGGASSDLVALNATTGDALWHAGLGSVSQNGPITYELDGKQYRDRRRRRHALRVRDEQRKVARCHE